MFRKVRFRISTLLLLVLAIALALGWIVDRQILLRKYRFAKPEIGIYGEKFSYWSPSQYLDNDTAYFESLLTGEIDLFEGQIVSSSQGMSSRCQLRQPTVETLESTLKLLDSDDDAVRLNAARLLALYLQAVSGSGNLDRDSFAIRVHFQVVGLPKTLALLEDENSDIRSAAALILGNTINDRITMDKMNFAFEEESDGDVKLYLAWAYWKLGHNYDKAEYYR